MYICTINSCAVCTSSHLCTSCSEYAVLEGNTCHCSASHCTICKTSRCNECETSYTLTGNGYCILEDKSVQGTTIAVTASVGIAVASSMASSALATAAGGGTVWSLFNTLQLIEFIALVELDYPEKLDQFFHGI